MDLGLTFCLGTNDLDLSQACKLLDLRWKSSDNVEPLYFKVHINIYYFLLIVMSSKCDIDIEILFHYLNLKPECM